MSRTVLAAVALTAIAASALAAPVVGYKLTLTEAGGAQISASAGVDSTSISCPSVPAGTYTGEIVCVDADGNPLTEPVLAAEQLVVVDVTTITVNVPASLTLSVVE